MIFLIKIRKMLKSKNVWAFYEFMRNNKFVAKQTLIDNIYWSNIVYDLSNVSNPNFENNEIVIDSDSTSDTGQNEVFTINDTLLKELKEGKEESIIQFLPIALRLYTGKTTYSEVRQSVLILSLGLCTWINPFLKKYWNNDYLTQIALQKLETEKFSKTSIYNL